MALSREYYAEITEYSIILILCLGIFTRTIYQIHYFNQKRVARSQIKKSNIILTICGMLGFIINLILQITFLFVDQKLDTLSEMVDSISVAFLFGGQCCVHLLFIDRLNAVFKKTQFRISHHALVIFYLMTFTFLLNWIAYSILHNLCYFGITNRDSTEIMHAILEWSGAFLDVSLCSMLLYLFTKRLFLVSISVNDEWLGNTTKYQLLPALNVIARCFILTVVSMIGVQITVIMAAMLDTDTIIFKEKVYPPVFLSIFWYIYPIQSLVAVYCLALNFYFANPLYMLLCGCIHRKCLKILLKRAKSSIVDRNEYNLMIDQQDEFM